MPPAECGHAHAACPFAVAVQADEPDRSDGVSDEAGSSLDAQLGLSRTVGIRGNQVLAGSMFLQACVLAATRSTSAHVFWSVMVLHNICAWHLAYYKHNSLAVCICQWCYCMACYN